MKNLTNDKCLFTFSRHFSAFRMLFCSALNNQLCSTTADFSADFFLLKQYFIKIWTSKGEKLFLGPRQKEQLSNYCQGSSFQIQIHCIDHVSLFNKYITLGFTPNFGKKSSMYASHNSECFSSEKFQRIF